MNSSSSAKASDQALIIRASESPTNGDSREPELNATHDGRIILSWVEKIGDKRYALRTSTRDGNGWAEVRTVAQGENWFVNWADFPSVIALQDGSLAAQTFGNPIQVDEGDAVGRVETLLLPDGSALVCWLSGTVESGAIKVRRIQPEGTLGPASVIAKIDISRSSGFPRMARLNDEVNFAWTEFGKPSHVRTAVADVVRPERMPRNLIQ